MQNPLLGAVFLAALIVSGCVSANSEANRLISAPRAMALPTTPGHVPAAAQVADDRDELIGILDSLYAHYNKSARRSTITSRTVVVATLVFGAVGAASSALVEGDRAERKLSQGASALTALLAGLGTEFQLSRKSEAQRACTATLYHALSDVRLRYSTATLPTTDASWERYVVFKDSIDRAVHLNCQ